MGQNRNVDQKGVGVQGPTVRGVDQKGGGVQGPPKRSYFTSLRNPCFIFLPAKGAPQFISFFVAPPFCFQQKKGTAGAFYMMRFVENDDAICSEMMRRVANAQPPCLKHNTLLSSFLNLGFLLSVQSLQSKHANNPLLCVHRPLQSSVPQLQVRF